MTVSTEIIIGFMTALMGAVVTIARFVYKEMRDERNWWRDRYMERDGIAAKAVDVAARAQIDG